MSILILADHDDGQLAAATLNTVTAAREIGGDIHILVAGDASGNVASAAAAIDGVAKVLTADDAVLSHGIAENVAPLIQSLASGYTHLMAPATMTLLSFMPARCWIAPEMPTATYRSGATTLPVWPTW